MAHSAHSFLADRQVVYYAGLDDIALPFGELLRVIPESPERHAVYLKALSLVVDHVVIPPSFYFPWVAPDSIPSRFPSLLAPLIVLLQKEQGKAPHIKG